MSDNLGSGSLYDFRANHQTHPNQIIEHLRALHSAHPNLFDSASIDGLAHLPRATNILTAAAAPIAVFEKSLNQKSPIFLALGIDHTCPDHTLRDKIVIDYLFRVGMPIAISQDLSPASEIDSLKGMVEEFLNRQLAPEEAEEVTRIVVDEGMYLDKGCLEKAKHSPYTTSLLFPSFLMNLAAEYIVIHPTAAPIETYNLDNKGGVLETINTKDTNVLDILKDPALNSEWKRYHLPRGKDGRPYIERHSDLGQKINDAHCIFEATNLCKKHDKHIVHLSHSSGSSLIPYAQKAGFSKQVVPHCSTSSESASCMEVGKH